MKTSRCLVVFVTCPTKRHAMRLARILVSKRLAACVNIVPNVQSLFWWQGKLDRASELLLVIKTTARCFKTLRQAVCKHHPYEVPEVIGLPIQHGHPSYLRWVQESLKVR